MVPSDANMLIEIQYLSNVIRVQIRLVVINDALLTENKDFHLIDAFIVIKFHTLICPFMVTVATRRLLTGCAAALNNISHLSLLLNGGNFLSGRNLLTAWGMNLTSLPLLLQQLLSLPTIVIKVHSFISFVVFATEK